MSHPPFGVLDRQGVIHVLRRAHDAYAAYDADPSGTNLRLANEAADAYERAVGNYLEHKPKPVAAAPAAAAPAPAAPRAAPPPVAAPEVVDSSKRLGVGPGLSGPYAVSARMLEAPGRGNWREDTVPPTAAPIVVRPPALPSRTLADYLAEPPARPPRPVAADVMPRIGEAPPRRATIGPYTPPAEPSIRDPNAPTPEQLAFARATQGPFTRLGEDIFGWLRSPFGVSRETKRRAMGEVAQERPGREAVSGLAVTLPEIELASAMGLPFGERLPISQRLGLGGTIERAFQRGTRTGAGLGAFSGAAATARGESPEEIARETVAGAATGVAWGAGGQAAAELYGPAWKKLVQAWWGRWPTGRDLEVWDPLRSAVHGDPYATLGLDAETATPAAATQARRSLAQRYAPRTAAESADPKANDRMAAINAAHDAVMVDLERRGRVAAPKPEAPAPPPPAPAAATPPAPEPPAAPARPVYPAPAPGQSIQDWLANLPPEARTAEAVASAARRGGWEAELERYAAGEAPAAAPPPPAGPEVPVRAPAAPTPPPADFRSPARPGDITEPIPEGLRRGTALYDAAGNAIPGTEILPPLKAGPAPRGAPRVEVAPAPVGVTGRIAAAPAEPQPTPPQGVMPAAATEPKPPTPPPAPAAPSGAPERITSPVVSVAGQRFTGKSHADAAEQAMRAMNYQGDRDTFIANAQERGRFLTSTGRTVDRAEAARIAGAAGQVTPEVAARGELHSEDLPAAAPARARRTRKPDLAAQTPERLRKKYGKTTNDELVARWNELQDRSDEAQRAQQGGGAGRRARGMAKLAKGSFARDQALIGEVEEVLRARGLDPDEMWLSRGHDVAARAAATGQAVEEAMGGEKVPEWVTRAETAAPVGTEAGESVWESARPPYGAGPPVWLPSQGPNGVDLKLVDDISLRKLEQALSRAIAETPPEHLPDSYYQDQVAIANEWLRRRQKTATETAASGMVPHKRSRAAIQRQLVAKITADHPDWDEAKVTAEQTKAELGLGEYAEYRRQLSSGVREDQAEYGPVRQGNLFGEPEPVARETPPAPAQGELLPAAETVDKARKIRAGEVEPASEEMATEPPGEKPLRIPGVAERSAPYGERLSALHNLSEADLQKSDKLGGLPIPSLAVVPESVPHTQYGDITLIGRSDLADPARTPIYSADAYTGRPVAPEYPKVRSAVAQKFIDGLRKLAGVDAGSSDIYEVWDNLVNYPNPTKVIDELWRSATGRAAFLAERGIKPAVTINVKEMESQKRFGVRDELIDQIRRAGLDADFAKWTHDQAMAQFSEPFLRLRGKKVPYTLENVVAASRPGRAKEKGLTYGPGTARAAASVRFSELEKMRGAAGKSVRPRPEVDEERKAIEQRDQEWRGAVVNYYTGTNWEGRPDIWNGLDAVYRALGRWAKGGKTAANLNLQLQREGFRDVPHDLLEEGIEVGKQIMSSSVPYFEGKPTRGVGFGEFAGAVIPENASATTKAILDKRRIPYRTYKTAEEREKITRDFRRQLHESGQHTLAEVGPLYHGSPHRFERFDISKIGTGEGAQVRGYGLYFAQRRGIGEHYRNVLAPTAHPKTLSIDGVPAWRQSWPEDVTHLHLSEQEILGLNELWTRLEGLQPTQKSLEQVRGELERTVANLPRRLKEMESLDPVYRRDVMSRARFETGQAQLALDVLTGPRKVEYITEEKGGGALYQVDLAGEEGDYLDLEKPLSDQSEKVKAALRKLGINPDAKIKYPSLKEALRLFESPRVLRDAREDIGTREVLAEGLRLAQSGNEVGFRRWFDLHGRSLSPGRVPDEYKTGEHAYQDLASTLWKGDFGGAVRPWAKAASDALREAGVRGLRYADASSRTEAPRMFTVDDGVIAVVGGDKPEQDFAAKDYSGDLDQAKAAATEELKRRQRDYESQRTYNYVVFDDKDITIKSVAEPQQLALVFGGEKQMQEAARLGLQANTVPTLDERRRAVKQAEPKGWVDVRGKRLTSAQDAALISRPFRSPTTENIEFLLKDDAGTVLSRVAMSSGAINYVDLDVPRLASEIARRAERVGATELQINHNHPSGNARPSDNDLAMTQRFHRELAAPRIGKPLRVTHSVTDHETVSVIRVEPQTGPERQGWVHRGGKMVWRQGDLSVEEALAISPAASGAPDWTAVRGPQVRSAEDAASLAGRIPDNELHILYRDNSGRAVALVPHRASATETIETWLPQEARSLGANGAIILIPGTGKQLWAELTHRRLPDEVLDVVGLDHASGVWDSAEDRGLLARSAAARWGMPAGEGRPARHVVGEEEAAPYAARGAEPVPAGRGAGEPVPESGAGAGERAATPTGAQEELSLEDQRRELQRDPDAPPLTDAQLDLLSKPPAEGLADEINLDEIPLVAPATERQGIRTKLQSLGRSIILGVNPEWAGAAARHTADTWRARRAEMFRAWAILKTHMASVDRVVAALPRREQLKVWAAFEAGKPTGNRKLDAPEGLPTLRRMTDAITNGLVKRDVLQADALIENYTGRYWQVDPAQLRALEGVVQGKRPIAGPRTFLKHRSWARMTDGLRAINEAQVRVAAGSTDPADVRIAAMKPLTYNVVRSQMAKIEEMLRAIAAHDIIVDEITAGRAKWVMDRMGKEPPTDANGELWVKVDPTERDPSFVKYGPREVEKKGEAVFVPGRSVLGHVYAPKQSATIWRHALSKGIRGDPVYGPIYEAYMAPANATTQILLGLSGFHFGTIGRESISASVELAFSAALQGKGERALANVARASGAPVLDAIVGRKVLQQYWNPGVHPELEPVLQAMIAGGYRGTAENEWYTGERTKLLRDAFHEAMEKENPAARRLWNGIKVPWDALWAGVELQIKPLMQYYVPALKAAAAYRAAADELAKLPPDADRAMIRERLGRTMKEMDYRYGQVVYDNYFMPKVVKDLAHAFFLAPGWTAGSAALLAKGVGGVPFRLARRLLGAEPKNEELVSRTTRYVLASVAVYMLVNALLNYLHTGEEPEGKDWWFPRDGTLDQDGNPNRYVIPGYEGKDWYDWPTHPIRTLLNKRKPLLGDFFRLIENRDYFGNMYYDPEHPTVGDIGKAAVRELGEPISFRNIAEAHRRQVEGRGGLGATVRGMIGAAPVPKEVQRTPAQNLMADYLARRGRTALTPEQQETSRARADTVRMLRQGAPLEASETLVRRAAKPSLVQRFQSLSLEQKEAVFERAKPWEQEMWASLLDAARQKAGGVSRARRRSGRRSP